MLRREPLVYNLEFTVIDAITVNLRRLHHIRQFVLFYCHIFISIAGVILLLKYNDL